MMGLTRSPVRSGEYFLNEPESELYLSAWSFAALGRFLLEGH